jgi:hypothetical protein
MGQKKRGRWQPGVLKKLCSGTFKRSTDQLPNN